jgi:hypothetical protein
MKIIHNKADTDQTCSVPKSMLPRYKDFDDDEEKDITINLRILQIQPLQIQPLQIQTSDHLCTSVSEIRMQGQ